MPNSGKLQKTREGLKLTLPDLTLWQADVIAIYDGKAQIECLPEKGLSMTGEADPRSVALDLKEVGVNIEITPDVSLKGFLQVPNHIHRGVPANWEFGNCL